MYLKDCLYGLAPSLTCLSLHARNSLYGIGFKQQHPRARRTPTEHYKQ